jgi:hypothetical protein
VNKVIAIALIFILSGQSLCKLGLITYFELHKDYIARVLCINKEEPTRKCNGHCYLKRNMEKTEGPAQTPTPRPTAKETLEIVIFLVTENSFPSLTASSLGANNFPPVKTEVSGFSKVPFHPPSAFC